MQKTSLKKRHVGIVLSGDPIKWKLEEVFPGFCFWLATLPLTHPWPGQLSDHVLPACQGTVLPTLLT